MTFAVFALEWSLLQFQSYGLRWMVLPTLAALLLEAGLLAWLRRDYRGVPAFVAACTLTLSGIATAYLYAIPILFTIEADIMWWGGG